MKSILAIDVGNSSTGIGLFTSRSRGPLPKPQRVWAYPTQNFKSRTLLRRALSRVVRRAPIGGVMISSVVPSVNGPLRAALQFLHAPIHFVSSTTPTIVKIRYRKPGEVGADRIVNARAAMALTKSAAIVVDFGTATTFDCVSGRGEYLGGVIAPGPVISAEALYQRTAQLPRVELRKPARILGRNTAECIESGLYHGYRGLVVEIVARLTEKLGRRTIVIATGGQSQWILKGLNPIHQFVPHLTLGGLFCIWKDMKISDF